MSSFTFISMYIGLRSRNPNRIKKIPQNVHGFVYRQSQLGNHAKWQSQHGTAGENSQCAWSDNLNTVTISERYTGHNFYTVRGRIHNNRTEICTIMYEICTIHVFLTRIVNFGACTVPQHITRFTCEILFWHTMHSNIKSIFSRHRVILSKGYWTDRGKDSITYLLVNKRGFPLRFHFDKSNLIKRIGYWNSYCADELTFSIYIKLLCNIDLFIWYPPI